MPNPRGSYGRAKHSPRPTARTSATATCATSSPASTPCVAKYPVDPKRLGITGWSYGGFMTMFAVTQTDRFKAAVAGAGIANWQSYYGENSIDQWMMPFFGASVYDDPAVYAKSSRHQLHQEGQDADAGRGRRSRWRVPAPQSFEFWHALKATSMCQPKLVVYPNEGHGFVDPEHRRDVMEAG